jgi:hypothetical protein
MPVPPRPAGSTGSSTSGVDRLKSQWAAPKASQKGLRDFQRRHGTGAEAEKKWLDLRGKRNPKSVQNRKPKVARPANPRPVEDKDETTTNTVTTPKKPTGRTRGGGVRGGGRGGS